MREIACRICGAHFDGRGDAANHLEDAHDVITNAVETRIVAVDAAASPEADSA